jgi:hypothetical protein
LDRGDPLPLGDDVDRIDVIDALGAILIALVDAIDADYPANPCGAGALRMPIVTGEARVFCQTMRCF